MEVKNIEDLRPDPRNPRTMSQHDAEALRNSLNTFGDLSSVVFNIRTQQLIGGHQRIEMMKRMPGERRVVITQRAGEGPLDGHEFLDEVGTKAVGYIFIGNKQFPYREVDFDEAKQHAANIASNRISGEFDNQLLAEITYDLSQLENGDELLALTGQSEDEITKLLQSVGAETSLEPEQGQDQQKQDDGMQRPKFKFTEEQYDVVYQAIGMMKRERQLTGEQNSDLDANALYYICRSYVENSMSQNNDPTPQNQTIDETPPAEAPTTASESPAAETPPAPDLTSIPA